jgi:hypothetical protein
MWGGRRFTLLYGIQMGKREPPMTEARVEEYARRFLGAGSGERKAASIASEATEQLDKALAPEEQVGRADRREFEQRSRTRGATQAVLPQKNPPAAAGAVLARSVLHGAVRGSWPFVNPW